MYFQYSINEYYLMKVEFVLHSLYIFLTLANTSHIRARQHHKGLL